MSRKRSSRALEAKGDSVTARLDRLLGDAKAKVGLIITAEATDAFKADPPTDADALTDAVLVAGGIDPLYADDALRRSVRELVDARMGRSN